MADSLDFVHSSGGLISPTFLADALSDTPRTQEGRRYFAPAAFAFAGHDPESPTDHAATIETTFELACEQWDKISRELDTLDTAKARDWMRSLLELLDFDPVYQRAHLRSDDGRDSFAIPYLGWDSGHAPPCMLAGEDLDAVPERGKRAPHDELQHYLNAAKAQWGIALSSRRFRVLRDFYHTKMKAFVGFDLDGIFETRDFPSFRALYRMAHRSRFIPDEDGKVPLDFLFDASQTQGIQIGRQLQKQVREAIEALGEGLIQGEFREQLKDAVFARGMYQELLLVAYRILFLLFAEQRRMLPPQGLYAETYSISALARLAESGTVESHHEDLWEGLKATFHMLSKGAPEVEVFPYNGQLFDVSRTGRLMAQVCRNQWILKAVKALTHVRIEGVRQRVNYAELGVEELGSVYESLLNYTLKVAEVPTQTEDWVVPVGAVFLSPLTTERKDLGAFYTRPELVDFVLSVSLDRLIQERREAAGKDHAKREHALLDIRVCDPACGSGAFLVGAIDRLALAVAEERTGGAKPTEQALQVARRDVLRGCIYGVDKDDFAVALCKVALWIHCAVPDMPLSFLDHRIQHGDSLVGWPLLGIPTTIPAEAYAVPSNINSSRNPEDRKLKVFLQQAEARNNDVLQGAGPLFPDSALPDIRVDFPAVFAEDERVPADVDKKSAAYEAYIKSAAYQRFHAAANLWAASFFWSPEAGAAAPTTADYQGALKGEANDRMAEAAKAILEGFPAFHWPLRFPEIRARGGFDCMVGNPPWEQVKLNEMEWFAPRNSEIAGLPSAPRRRAIEQLSGTNRQLHREWRQAQVAYIRLADHMRCCGRFSGSGHEPNTYLLFTEHVADSLRPNGRCGVLVKSALALDKSASGLFGDLVQTGRVEEFHDHVNGGPTGSTLIFEAVDAKERFVVLSLRGAGRPEEGFAATVMNWNVNEGRLRPRQRITPEILRIINPKTHTFTSFRREEEFQVALDIHRRLPILDFEEGGDNPWGLSYHTLFHSSGASDLFHRREDLEADGWELGEDKIFRREPHPSARAERGQAEIVFGNPERGVERALPLFEGQMIDRYDHRAKTYEGYTGDNKYGRAPGIPATTDAQKAWPQFEIEPRYWIMEPVAKRRIDSVIGDKVMIGFRDVGAPWRNQRSVKAAIMPRYPATHTIPILSVPKELAFPFIALFASTCLDFLVRGHMPSGHVALTWMLAQIPSPDTPIVAEAVPNSRRLSLTSKSVADQFGAEPHQWDSGERTRLDAEVDAILAHAYGLTQFQYAVVLDSFEVMAREQIKKHGRYRFKDDCLAAFMKAG